MTWRFLVMLLGTALAVGCHGDSASSSGAPVQIGRLRFLLPAGWRQVPPNSSMRVAQAVIPGAAGEGELAVFFFGAGQGGNVEANLQRWMNQVVAEAGNEPRRETFESNGLRVTWVEVHGTLKPGQMGMGPATSQANAEMLGAVIEGDGGPWFLKATGPQATLAPQRDAFIAMLRTARVDGG